MGVTGARTQLELLGQSCFAIQSQPQPRQSCVVSRSFAKTVTDLGELKGAISMFSARASERLRHSGLVAAEVNTFILADRFKDGAGQHNGSATVALMSPSNFTADITRAALIALQQAYRPGAHYKKAGVMVLGLAPEGQVQPTLFAAPAHAQVKSQRLQCALDALNGGKHAGRDLVRVGAFRGGSGDVLNGKIRRDCRSPRYTTQWSELKKVQG